MSPRSRPQGVLHVAAVTTAALAFMAGGCGATTSSAPAAQTQPTDDEVVSCGYEGKDENGQDVWIVLPDDECDDDGNGHGGGGFIGVFSSRSNDPHRNSYTTPGSRLPRAAVPLKGAPIRYNDAGARSAAGLPRTGKVAGPRAIGNSGIGQGATGGKSGGSSGSGGKSGGTGGSGGS